MRQYIRLKQDQRIAKHFVTINVPLSALTRRAGAIQKLGLFRVGLNSIITYLIAAPLALLVFTSFRDTSANQLPWATTFTVNNYAQLFGDTTTYRVLLTTAEYAVGAATFGLVLATALVISIERTQFRLRRTVQACVMAPLGLPGFVAAMCWVMLANPQNGVINGWYHSLFGGTGPGPVDIYTVWGMIFIAGLLFVPSMYLMISGSAIQIDPSLEDSSLTSGASPARTIRRVTLPLLKPSLTAAAMFFLMVGIDTFEVPLFVGVPGHHYTLSTWIFTIIEPFGAAIPNYGLACAFGVCTTALAIGLVAVYRRSVRTARNFVTVSGKAFRLRRRRASRLTAVGAGAVGITYLVIGFVLPLLTLVFRSLIPPFALLSVSSLHHLTYANYVQVWRNGALGTPLKNTAVIALVAALGTMALALAKSWLSWRRGRAPGAIEGAIFGTLGVPAVIIAIAMLLLYLWLPFGLNGTIWVIAMAMIVRYLPYGMSTMGPALLQLDRDLDHAAALGGAGDMRRLLTITLPLVSPAFIRGCLWVFVQAARDATIVVILLSLANVTIGGELYTAWFERGNYAYASAVSVLLALASVVLSIVLVRFDPVARAEAKQ